MTTFNSSERTITIEGLYNLRDVGGYSAHGGGIRWRTLLRSASPFGLSAASWQALGDAGVQTLIDLRRTAETQERPYADAINAGMQYRHMPLFDDSEYETIDRASKDLSELYVRFLDHCGPQFARIIGDIATDPSPTLVHCAVGKDRTGMVIALTLGALGVDIDTIAADYVPSYELLSPLVPFAREEVRAKGGDLERLERMFESRYETMIDTLNYLNQRYGGFGSYLEMNGVTAPTIEALRRKMVVPEP